MDTYVRFQTQLRCCNSGRPAGIFVAAGRVEDRKKLAFESCERLQGVLAWFNQNLPVPGSYAINWRSRFWFRSSSQLVISRLWELVWLLEEENIFVSKVRTQKPGMIVYRDEYQVAAVPQRKRN